MSLTAVADRNSRFKRSLRKAALALQNASARFGVIATPNHYYASVADINELRRTKADWAVRAPLHGITMDLDAQLDRLEATVACYEPEYRGNQTFLEAQAASYGLGYGYIEAQCLYGMLRSVKPSRMIEIGSGVSTHCATKAFAKNAAEGRPGEIICIEPYPSAYLRSSPNVRLIESVVQSVRPEVFDALGPGDLLFVDSSHAVRPGGDVIFIYLSIIPRLRSGVIVHIHDIYFPYLYQRDLLDSFFQWSESALLAALLCDNARLDILYCLSMLHYDAPARLQRIFPEYERASDSAGLADHRVPGQFPSSIYLTVK